jgi:hypothetical protein
MIHDIFSQLFLAVFVAAYLVFLAALAWWALGGRLRFVLKPQLVPALRVLRSFGRRSQQQDAPIRARESRAALQVLCGTRLIVERGLVRVDHARRNLPF